jgi:dephospho-CoA kinase
MKLCGLTGGVGMGKSTAARFFRERGAPVVDTDQLAHELVQPGQPALAAIRETFGPGILSPDGSLRRGELAAIVFGDPAARRKLEAILHPRIRERWMARVESWRAESHPLAVVVIPLLYETQAEGHFDTIICAGCTAPAQYGRLLARGWTSEQIQQRLAAQMPAEEKIARANFVIWTEGSLEVHSRQVDAIFDRLSPPKP